MLVQHTNYSFRERFVARSLTPKCVLEHGHCRDLFKSDQIRRVLRDVRLWLKLVFRSRKRARRREGAEQRTRRRKEEACVEALIANYIDRERRTKLVEHVDEWSIRSWEWEDESRGCVSWTFVRYDTTRRLVNVYVHIRRKQALHSNMVTCCLSNEEYRRTNEQISFFSIDLSSSSTDAWRNSFSSIELSTTTECLLIFLQ